MTCGSGGPRTRRRYCRARFRARPPRFRCAKQAAAVSAGPGVRSPRGTAGACAALLAGSSRSPLPLVLPLAGRPRTCAHWSRWPPSLCRGRSSANRCADRTRSEEHTSELQSRGHLVCRLLLEKKKKKIKNKKQKKKKKKKKKKKNTKNNK